jgi:hypothetical protein
VTSKAGLVEFLSYGIFEAKNGTILNVEKYRYGTGIKKNHKIVELFLQSMQKNKCSLNS